MTNIDVHNDDEYVGEGKADCRVCLFDLFKGVGEANKGKELGL